MEITGQIQQIIQHRNPSLLVGTQTGMRNTQQVRQPVPGQIFTVAQKFNIQRSEIMLLRHDNFATLDVNKKTLLMSNIKTTFGKTKPSIIIHRSGQL